MLCHPSAGWRRKANIPRFGSSTTTGLPKGGVIGSSEQGSVDAGFKGAGLDGGTIILATTKADRGPGNLGLRRVMQLLFFFVSLSRAILREVAAGRTKVVTALRGVRKGDIRGAAFP